MLDLDMGRYAAFVWPAELERLQDEPGTTEPRP